MYGKLANIPHMSSPRLCVLYRAVLYVSRARGILRNIIQVRVRRTPDELYDATRINGKIYMKKKNTHISRSRFFPFFSLPSSGRCTRCLLDFFFFLTNAARPCMGIVFPFFRLKSSVPVFFRRNSDRPRGNRYENARKVKTFYSVRSVQRGLSNRWLILRSNPDLRADERTRVAEIPRRNKIQIFEVIVCDFFVTSVWGRGEMSDHFSFSKSLARHIAIESGF